MTVTAWRITKEVHARQAFDGEGARLNGGRWNSAGTAMVYLAENAALAVLEMMVHIEITEAINLYVLIPVTFDSKFVRSLPKNRIPRDWAANPPSYPAQTIGDKWIAGGRSLLLSVPSTVVPTERNFLLNPKHRDFLKLRIGNPQRFHFDPRLFKKP